MKTKCMSCGGSMKKMAVGGTTTKRIIKKSTGGMYGIPQENMGTSGQYGFAKKGGTVKKMQKGGPIIKSKKVRDVSLNTFGDSYAKTTKTKRDGSTVTKSVDTTRGYVPTASMTKTVKDKTGNVKSSTKDIGYNKAVRKQLSTGRKAGRNPEDEVIVDGRQKGGAVKKYVKGGSLKPVPSDKVGLAKLPTAVRNKMGYMKKGGVKKK